MYTQKIKNKIKILVYFLTKKDCNIIKIKKKKIKKIKENEYFILLFMLIIYYFFGLIILIIYIANPY